ncbi:MAG: hypothetical protein ABSD42_01460 [Candidatus Bathyarchaeia archaeon]|jgi:hypothetical protein
MKIIVIVAIVIVAVVILLAIVGAIVYFSTSAKSTSFTAPTPAPATTLTPAPTPYPSPTSTLIINGIQVSGTITIAGVETQPTSMEFLDTATNSGYFTTVQNGLYSTSLPNQQTYEVFATCGGLTVSMGTFNLNAGVGITSITKNFSG